MALGIVLLLGAVAIAIMKGINAGSIILLVLSLIPIVYEFIFQKRRKTSPVSMDPLKIIVSVAAIALFVLICRLGPAGTDYKRSVIINKSISQMNKGNYVEAESALKKLFESDQNPLIATNLASIYLKKHDAQNARTMLDAAQRTLYMNEKQWFNYGLFFLQQKDYNNAVPHFEKALELNPGFVMAHLYAGTAALNLRDLKRAQYHLEEAAFLNPVRPDIQYYLGRVYTEMMDYKKAGECFKKAQNIKNLPEDISNLLKQRLDELKPYLGGNDNE